MTFDETFDLSRLLELRKEYKDAAEVYRLASGKSLPMEQRLELMRSYVMTACDDTDGADAALREAQSWKKLINENNAQQVRTLQAAIAYAAVAAGDGKTARAALDQLAPKDRGALTGTAYNDAQIRQGVLRTTSRATSARRITTRPSNSSTTGTWNSPRRCGTASRERCA